MTVSSKSLVLVTADCLRADHAGFLGYPRPTTPFLDSLVPESLIFSNAFVAGSPTYYSLPAMLASRYPLAHGRDVIGLAPGEPTLAGALRNSGWATAAFEAGNPYLSKRFGVDQGFDVFQDFLRGTGSADAAAKAHPPQSPRGLRTTVNQALAKTAHELGPVGSLYDELYFRYCQRVAGSQPETLNGLRRFPAANVLVTQAQDWIASLADRPFFLWLHLMDCHAPYYPTEEALALMRSPVTASRARYLNSYWNRSDIAPARLARHRDDIIALYDASLRWVDQQVSRLAGTLRELGLWDDCCLAFTADHGEEFLDHGSRYHPPSRLSEEVIHVPLLIRAPKGTTADIRGVHSAPFSHVDLAPTLLESVGVAAPQEFQGRSVWAQSTPESPANPAVVIESVASCTNPMDRSIRLGPRMLVVREARYKLVFHFEGREEQLYDLEADPHETSPLPMQAARPVRRRLLERAQAHLQNSASERDPTQRLRSKLRDLQLELALPVAQ